MRTTRIVMEAALARLERDDAYRHSMMAVIRNYLATLDDIDLRLTEKQGRVLQMIAEGRGDKEIGSAFGISESGAKHYVADLLERFHANGRANLAARFLRVAS